MGGRADDNNHKGTKFVSVTEHFGYTCEKNDGYWSYVIWYAQDNNPSHRMAIRENYGDAVERCNYYEQLFYNEEEKNHGMSEM